MNVKSSLASITSWQADTNLSRATDFSTGQFFSSFIYFCIICFGAAGLPAAGETRTSSSGHLLRKEKAGVVGESKQRYLPVISGITLSVVAE